MSRKNSIYETVHTGGSGEGYGVVKPEDMALLQEKLFENLSYFADFCDTHGIKYVLAAGTCLGAARGNDFIPWDDDLDVSVLRDDFNKLFELWEEYGDRSRFSLYRTDEKKCIGVPIGLLRNNNTTFIRRFEKERNDLKRGVKIDIEPMDEITESKIQRIIQYICGLIYALFLTQRKPNQTTKLKKCISYFLLTIFKGKYVRNKIISIFGDLAQQYNGTDCKVVAINGAGCPMLKSDILNPSKLLFHGKLFNVPGNYDAYLKREYGNYMEKPPIEKRKPLDNPYYYNFNEPCS